MASRLKRRLQPLLPALALLAAACRIPGAAPDSLAGAHGQPCSAQVVVSFAAPVGPVTDAAFVADLAGAAGVQLTFLRAAGAGLYVFALAGGAADPGCAAALDRLRRDPRVRSADADERRAPHD
jgi:hypothetical protein